MVCFILSFLAGILFFLLFMRRLSVIAEPVLFGECVSFWPDVAARIYTFCMCFMSCTAPHWGRGEENAKDVFGDDQRRTDS